MGLGTFGGDKKLEQVWAALSAAALEPSGPARMPGEHYAISAVIHPPEGSTAYPARLIKSIVDGVVSAFQAHADAVTRPEVARRISRTLNADSRQIAEWLSDDKRCAVLGVAPSIVHVRSEGVQWSPADSDLVAADLRLGPALGDHWGLSGEIHTGSSPPSSG